MKNKFLIALPFIALAFGSVQSRAMISTETKQFADRVGAANLTEIKFDEKQTSLTDSYRKELASLVNDARNKGEIQKVKVMVWADRDYPPSGQAAPKSDVALADKRSEEVKKYLKEQLNVPEVETYNMAERPGTLAHFFGTSDAQVKETAEASGAAPRTKDETGFFGLKGQTSKAVAFVFMK